MEINIPTHRSNRHCQVAQKANRISQNLSKSLAAPSLTEKKARAYNKMYKSLDNKWLIWGLEV